jgi:hypothetical protein
MRHRFGEPSPELGTTQPRQRERPPRRPPWFRFRDRRDPAKPLQLLQMVIDHPRFQSNDITEWSLRAELAGQVIPVPRTGFAQRQKSQNGVFGGHPRND